MQERFLTIGRLRARLSLQLTCLILATLLLGYYAYAGFCLGNSQNQVSHRMQFHAIPVALSYLYYGKQHDLTAYKGMAFEFQAQQTPLPLLLQKYSSGADKAGVQQQPTYYWTADDRGMGDFTILAFRLFGPHLSSLYWLYIALLAISIAAYVLTHYRDELSMTALVVLLSGYVVALFAAVLNGTNANFHENLVPIHDSRTLDAFAIIGLAHILLVALRRQPVGLAGFAGLTVQTVILCLVLLARSSLKLGILSLICGTLALMAYDAVLRWKAVRNGVVRQGSAASGLKSAAIAFVFLLSVPVLTQIYQNAVYNHAYRNTVRTVWHNVLMGVGVPQPGVPFPRSHPDDREAIEAVVAHHNAQRPDTPWDVQAILNSLGGHVEFDWRAYEAEARDIFFDLWRQEPVAMISWYLYGKPLIIAKLLATAATNDFDLPSKGYSRFCPETCEAELTLIHWPVLVILLIVAVIARTIVLRYWTPVFAILLAGAIVYLIPSIVFYEFILNLLGTITLGAAMIYWIAAGLMAKAVSLWIDNPRRSQLA